MESMPKDIRPQSENTKMKLPIKKMKFMLVLEPQGQQNSWLFAGK